jgi:hypothetical protein
LIPASDYSVSPIFTLYGFRGRRIRVDRNNLLKLYKISISCRQKNPLGIPEIDRFLEQHIVAIGCFWPNFSQFRLLYWGQFQRIGTIGRVIRLSLSAGVGNRFRQAGQEIFSFLDFSGIIGDNLSRLCKNQRPASLHAIGILGCEPGKNF